MGRLLLIALAALLLAAPAASAQSTVAEAAQALATDPVYVAPDAEKALSSSEADELRQRIQDSGAGPMYVAVLPKSALDEGGGSAEGVAREIAQRLQRQGVYAVVAGTKFSAGGTNIRGAGDQATEALQAHRKDGVSAVLLDFTDRVGAAARGRDALVRRRRERRRRRRRRPALLLLPLLALGGGALLISRKRRRRQEARGGRRAQGERPRRPRLARRRHPGARPRRRDAERRPAAKADYAKRGRRLRPRRFDVERARQPEDFEPIGAALEEGRYAMTSAKALLAGEAPPARTPPCFFDPRHGPSSREVEWAPAGGAPRLVPACEADAQRVERGEDPHAREVLVGGQRVPYWNAGPMYAPFAGGLFGGFGGGLLPGLMVGTLLGSSFGGWGMGDAYASSGVGDGDWGGGGGVRRRRGDFGGGDFGGGGGDFGGGDF